MRNQKDRVQETERPKHGERDRRAETLRDNTYNAWLQRMLVLLNFLILFAYC